LVDVRADGEVVGEGVGVGEGGLGFLEGGEETTGETGKERRGEGGVSAWVKGRRGRGRGRAHSLDFRASFGARAAIDSRASVRWGMRAAPEQQKHPDSSLDLY